MTSSLIAEISCAIASATGEAFRVKDCFSAAGGCINRSLILVGDNDRRFFVKINKADLLAMFEAESEDLFMLANARSLRVPVPLTYGLAAGESFLVMEWLHLSRRGDGQKLGVQLAWLHRNSWHAFGWPHDNTIGGTHQVNRPANDWVQFYRNQRLRPQLELAARHGAASNLIDSGNRLLASVGSFFSGYLPQPSLLHGDLWHGNTGFCEDMPVVFDPATYYGDRESDIAMTELFGGFPGDFYAAYNAAWPLDQGYPTRKLLYQLYHLLNHFNLFGGDYCSQSQAAISRLLAEL